MIIRPASSQAQDMESSLVKDQRSTTVLRRRHEIWVYNYKLETHDYCKHNDNNPIGNERARSRLTDYVPIKSGFICETRFDVDFPRYALRAIYCLIHYVISL